MAQRFKWLMLSVIILTTSIGITSVRAQEPRVPIIYSSPPRPLPATEPLTVANAGRLEQLATIGGESISALAWFADRTRVAIGTQSECLITDLDSDAAPSRIAAPGGVISIGISMDGSQLACVLNDRRILLWTPDRDNAARVIDVVLAFGTVAPVFSPDGTKLAVPALFSHLVWILDVLTGKQILILDPLEDQINAVQWRPDNRLIIVCQWRILIYDTNDFHQVRLIRTGLTNDSPPARLLLGERADRVVWAIEDRLYSLDLTAGAIRSDYPPMRAAYDLIAVDPTGERIIVGRADLKRLDVRLLDGEETLQAFPIRGLIGAPQSETPGSAPETSSESDVGCSGLFLELPYQCAIHISPDWSLVAVQSLSYGALTIADATTGRLRAVFAPWRYDLTRAPVTITASEPVYDPTQDAYVYRPARAFNTMTGALDPLVQVTDRIVDPAGFSFYAQTHAYSHDYGRVASYDGRQIVIRDARTGTEFQRLVPSREGGTLAFSRDGSQLFQFDLGAITRYDLNTGKQETRLYETPFERATLSPDGRYVLVDVDFRSSPELLALNGDVVAYDSITGEQVAILGSRPFQLFGSSARRSIAALSPHGSYVLLCFNVYNGCGEVWSLDTMEQVGTITTDDRENLSSQQALFSEDETLIGLMREISPTTNDGYRREYLLFEAATGKIVAVIPLAMQQRSILFSANGRYLLSRIGANSVITVWGVLERVSG